jgi:hypothetical protein
MKSLYLLLAEMFIKQSGHISNSVYSINCLLKELLHFSLYKHVWVLASSMVS